MATLLRADPTFYASPRLAMQAPAETVAYVIIVNPGKGPDGLAVVDANRAGYSRPHTSHCGPDGIYVSALGSPTGDGPGGIFIVDHDSFEVRGRWELDRGPQYLAYDFWWHLGYDTMITSEWGTPKMIEDGVNPDILRSEERRVGKEGSAGRAGALRKARLR